MYTRVGVLVLPAHSDLERGILENDGWGFASQFERDLFQIAFGASFLDGFAGLYGSCKADLFDAHV